MYSVENLESEKSIECGLCPAFGNSHLAWTYTDFDIHSISMMQTRVTGFVIWFDLKEETKKPLSHCICAQVCIGHHEPVSQYSETLTETAGNSYQLVVEMSGLPTWALMCSQPPPEKVFPVCGWGYEGEVGENKQRRMRRDGPTTCPSVCSPSYCVFGIEAERI